MAQATRAGKCLPAAGQGRLPGGGDLQGSPRGPAAATICLKPKAARGTSRKFTYEEAGELEPAASRVRRPHDKLRQHLRRAKARPWGSHSLSIPLVGGRTPTAAQRATSATPRSRSRDSRVLARAAPAALRRRGAGPFLASLPFLRGREPLRRGHGDVKRPRRRQRVARRDELEGLAPFRTYSRGRPTTGHYDRR